MLIISFLLALIVIVLGMMLLAQSKRDNLHGVYKYVAWIIIVLGGLVALCHGGMMMMNHCHRGGMNKECMMMNRCDDGMMGCGPMMCMPPRRGGMNCCGMMMNCGPNNCCNSMMNCGGGQCSNGVINGSCFNGMNSCSDGNKSGMGSCPMMGGMKKADSAKKK